MKYALVFFLLVAAVHADQIATTEGGHRVIIRDGGTWTYADSKATAEFSGNGLRNTSPFTTRGPWEIEWQSKGDLLQLSVFRLDGRATMYLAQQIGPGSGSTFVPEAGGFYLQISGMGSWVVRVLE